LQHEWVHTTQTDPPRRVGGVVAQVFQRRDGSVWWQSKPGFAPRSQVTIRSLILLFRNLFMPKSIYVGNLPFNATEDEVRSLFEAHGNVLSVKLISDRETGRPRGFAFVEMDSSDAAAAISALDGADMNGRSLRVNEAMDRGAGPGGGGGPGGPGGPRRGPGGPRRF
jgi:RNA recognition motif-containing protein